MKTRTVRFRDEVAEAIESYRKSFLAAYPDLKITFDGAVNRLILLGADPDGAEPDPRRIDDEEGDVTESCDSRDGTDDVA